MIMRYVTWKGTRLWIGDKIVKKIKQVFHLRLEENMIKDMDKIQFESRTEIAELMKVIDKYIKQNPAEKQNKTVERFFDLLDVMLMEW